jgi:hypothetical protein
VPDRERPEEDAARYVVETVAGVELVRRDGPGAPPATHDFDVVRAGVPIGALEVTMLVEEPRQRLLASIASRSFVEAPQLRSAWIVWLGEGAIHGGIRLKDFGRRIVHSSRHLKSAASQCWI